VKIAAWEEKLLHCLPAFGHRNWIVVADAAYPLQTAPGIEMVVAPGDPADILRRVLETIDGCAHVRPTILMDSELNFVSGQDAPGAAEFRMAAAHVLGNREVRQMPHEEIIAELDAAGRQFRVLVIKTALLVPYTSVFMRLECGYWTADSESRLRSNLSKTSEKQRWN
jgi:L-fucose mutarotase/ribose pyranase (RbsD/FucU family)